MIQFAEFSAATKARNKLMVKLKTDSIYFVPWHFGHAYFFEHSFVRLNELILMGGKCREFKRLDQFLSDDNDNQMLRPWEKYKELSLPNDYSLSDDESSWSETVDTSWSDSDSESSESESVMESTEIISNTRLQI